MATREELRKLLTAVPFKPFDVVISGMPYNRINSPELISCSTDGRQLVMADDDGLMLMASMDTASFEPSCDWECLDRSENAVLVWPYNAMSHEERSNLYLNQLLPESHGDSWAEAVEREALLEWGKKMRNPEPAKHEAHPLPMGLLTSVAPIPNGPANEGSASARTALSDTPARSFALELLEKKFAESFAWSSGGATVADEKPEVEPEPVIAQDVTMFGDPFKQMRPARPMDLEEADLWNGVYHESDKAPELVKSEPPPTPIGILGEAEAFTVDQWMKEKFAEALRGLQAVPDPVNAESVPTGIDPNLVCVRELGDDGVWRIKPGTVKPDEPAEPEGSWRTRPGYL